MPKNFVHLRLHTEFSLIDGIVRIDELMAQLPEKGMNAVAVTDHCNLFAVVKTYQAAIAKGIKPIVGCEIPYHDIDKPEKVATLVLLCQNELGYRNLTRLVSKAYQEGQYQGEPHVQYAWFEESALQGTIALSGGMSGDVGQALLAGDQELACHLATSWSTVFPKRFYLEIQRTDRAEEETYNRLVVALAERLSIPLVATNDVRFIAEEDFEAHEARVCIHEGHTLSDPRRKIHYSRKQYLRSAEEMTVLFCDLPEALANTVEIAKRCTLMLELGKNYLPNFPVPNEATVEAYLCQLSAQGLEARLKKILPSTEQQLTQRSVYEARLQWELGVINSMGFAGYFLIVADFIQWAKKNGVPVGPGRGSGAGSLVAYALNITDLDPLAYDLLFERFLNPERVSMPDFDIDFCMEGRDRVIDYVAEKYGRQSVSQIITFGTMAAKAVVRDVGRVLGHPYGFVDKLAKLIPFELGITLKKALDQEAELRLRYDNEEEVTELMDLALKLEGITRNAGKHAGGVVIAPSKLTDFTAIYCEQGSTQIVSQFDKDDVESVGLVKFDFLGLRTLTIIDWALATINQSCSTMASAASLVDIADIPLDDEATFALLKSCQTTAVFQLESRGMKELIHRLQPDCFEDIIALVALFRPGPLQSGMVDDFIDRKHGRALVAYPHPDLEPILKPTYGVILYQEQVMQIAQVLANYTLGAADLLRRAMGKKKPEEMAKQRAIFTEGASARGVDAQTATTIFDLMEKFAGYGFNKSHSAAYALVAYQTAWLKAHYPAAFMAAVMSSDMDNTDKVVIFLNECKQMGLHVLPPCINQSQLHFSVMDAQTIRYGLGAIKGVGEAAIQAIVATRSQKGVFSGLFDFCQRLDMRKVNRRVLDALIKSGAMDAWGVDRASLSASVEKAMQMGLKFHQNQQSGQTDLWSLFEDAVAEDYLRVTPWREKILLDGEKETLGFYFSGHPAAQYLKELASVVTPIGNLNASRRSKATICGLVTSLRRIVTKRGKKLAIVQLEDATHPIDVVVFSEIFDACGQAVVVGQPVIVEGDLAQDDYTGGTKMTATSLYTIADARARFAKCLVLKLGYAEQALLPSLQETLKQYRGQCIVQIRYTNTEASAAINLSPDWAVTPSDELLAALWAILGIAQVELCY